MKDSENLNVPVGHPIWRDVRRVGDDKLARPGEPARPAHMRMFAEGLGRGDDARDDALSSPRVVAPDEIGDRFKIG